MKNNIYWKYFKYVLEHKKNVFKVCWNKGMHLHAFAHDLSKFSKHEFQQYAKWFHGEYGVKYNPDERIYVDVKSTINLIDHYKFKDDFDLAWQHHKDNNKHHWNYWNERDLGMPEEYIEQMICDWDAMSIKFGDTALDFYSKNKDNIQMSDYSRRYLHWRLGYLVQDDKFTSEDMSKSCRDLDYVSGYLQGGYGIWLFNKKKNQIGHIHDFVAPELKNVLGHDIIVGHIEIYRDEYMSDKLTREFMGKILVERNDESIW